jgi:hypothetical protein
MNANDMVKVFIKRSIAAGGFPFDMRAPPNDPAPTRPLGERNLIVHGVSVPYLANVASKAAQAAHATHVAAGRMPADPTPDATHGYSR